MKITVNVECTPEEARRYFGLPDVTQFNEQLMKNMADQMSGMGHDNFMTAWEPFFKNMTSFWTAQSK